MAFPGTYNFNYYRGDTYEFKVYPKLESGAAFDLTGYTATFTVANKRGSGATQFPMVAPTINTAEGSILCAISTTNGRNLTSAGAWVYDVQISKTNGGYVHTLLTGTINVTEDVTGAQ